MSPTGPADSGARPDFTAREFRDALSEFATGVTIVCTRGHDGRYAGFTANSFNSVSLDPPLVVWSLAQASATLKSFESCDRYAVSVLAENQIDLALRFSQPHEDRFEGVAYRLGWAAVPLIEGAVAWFECRHYQTFAAGDHVMFIGEVVRCGRSPGRGLVFHAGRFARAEPVKGGD